jgi:hypothetical protein
LLQPLIKQQDKSVKKLVIVLAATACCAPVWAQSVSGNQFNPAISLIINGGFADYSEGSELEIAGFPVVGEAGQPEEGFGLFEAELTMSSNIDDSFYGNLNLGIHQDGGETEVDIEEAWIQTLALPYGLTAKAGKFRSELGYLNPQHPHSYDFADAPLLYSAMVGGAYADTGVQTTWLAPLDNYLEFGLEYTRGDAYPAGGSGNDGKGSVIAFAKTGGDINDSQAWQLSIARMEADEVSAELTGHAHGDEEEADNEFEGESSLSNVSFVWKWAPKGNNKERSATVQAEYMTRKLEGEISHVSDTENVQGTLDSDQSGFYIQGVYKFAPKWRAGLRYSSLTSDNLSDNDDALEETGFADEGNKPSRTTVMLDYSNSEFSRIRFQFSKEDETRHADEGEIDNRAIYVQYIHSLGAHGAHRF